MTYENLTPMTSLESYIASERLRPTWFIQIVEIGARPKFYEVPPLYVEPLKVLLNEVKEGPKTIRELNEKNIETIPPWQTILNKEALPYLELLFDVKYNTEFDKVRSYTALFDNEKIDATLSLRTAPFREQVRMFKLEWVTKEEDLFSFNVEKTP